MMVGSVILMYGTAILTLLRMKRRRRKSGLACLSCSKPLTLVPAQIAVATGICCHCGGSIFSGKSTVAPQSRPQGAFSVDREA